MSSLPIEYLDHDMTPAVSDGSGAGLQFLAQISASLGGIASQLSSVASRREKLLQCLRQVPFACGVTLTAGAGTTDTPDTLSAKTGYNWSVRRITATGFSAGTVTMYRNSALGEIMVSWPAGTPGTFTFGRAEMLLEPTDRLIFVAAGITGTVQVNGVADCFESWLLPDYIL
jgi:hypothetical protein